MSVHSDPLSHNLFMSVMCRGLPVDVVYICVCAWTQLKENKGSRPPCQLACDLSGFSLKFPFALHRMGFNKDTSAGFEKPLAPLSGGLNPAFTQVSLQPVSMTSLLSAPPLP